MALKTLMSQKYFRYQINYIKINLIENICTLRGAWTYLKGNLAPNSPKNFKLNI